MSDTDKAMDSVLSEMGAAVREAKLKKLRPKPPPEEVQAEAPAEDTGMPSLDELAAMIGE